MENKNLPDGIYYIVLKPSQHKSDTEKYGDYILPFYTDKEKLLKNHPKTPYLTIILCEHILSVMGKGDKPL